MKRGEWPCNRGLKPFKYASSHSTLTLALIISGSLLLWGYLALKTHCGKDKQKDLWMQWGESERSELPKG